MMVSSPHRTRFVLLLTAFCASTALAGNGPDPNDLDPRTPACQDFYQHANGGWLARTVIPAGRGSWSRFDELNQRALERQRALLDAAAASPADDTERLLGDFWASGLDEAAVEAAGARPLAPLLARIDRAGRPRDLPALIADLHARGIPVLFNFGADIDLRDFGRRIAYATQAGLGLPDRDYYLRQDEDARALLGRYRAHIERLLALTGTPAGELGTRSAQVLEIEMRLAAASLGLVELRDPYHAYRPTPLRELDRRYPRLRLADFARAQGLRQLDSVSLAHDRFFQAADGLLAALPTEHWQAYLRFHVANALAPHLSQAFRDAHHALYGELLAGEREPAPRWRQVLATLDAALGDALGRKYVERHLPEAARAEAEAIVIGVRDALARAIDAVDWLGDDARAAAREKLATLRVEVGAPAYGHDHAGLRLDRRDYAANVLAVAKWRHARELAGIGRQTPLQWRVPPQTPDIAYDPALNRLTVTAAALQPPIFHAGGEPALNHGALGALVGQQLTHAFDAKGRTIDGSGRFRDWWSAEDAQRFEARVAPLVAQYDGYLALGPVRVNGRVTRDENIADLGGVELALSALGAASGGTLDARQMQRFFLGYATLWQRKYTEDELRLRLATGVHAPAKFRVNGPLANLPAFAEAFGCRAGQPMASTAAVALWR